MKNDIFNFRRFGKYFSTDIKACWSDFGLSLITISILVPVALYIITAVLNLAIRMTWDGPDMGIRVLVFIIAMICLIATMPVKCYGKVTERQYGSFFLTLPASRLEKVLSMLLLTCLIVPFAGIAIYIGTDSVICALDRTCGNSLIAGFMEFARNVGNIQEMTFNLPDEKLTIENAELAQNIISQISSPWLYVDEIFCITLPFLLGAIYFKSGKTVKTFIVIFAVSMATSMSLTPYMENWAAEMISNAGSDPDTILQMFNNGIFRNLVLIDTVSDMVVNLALIAGIWFRIKTLKH